MTQFTKEYQPPKRGTSFKTKLLKSIQEKSLLELEEGQSPEEAYIEHVASRAFDQDDQASGMLLKELMSRSYPTLKATMPVSVFDFDSKAPAHQQVAQLLDALKQCCEHAVVAGVVARPSRQRGR